MKNLNKDLSLIMFVNYKENIDMSIYRWALPTINDITVNSLYLDFPENIYNSLYHTKDGYYGTDKELYNSSITASAGFSSDTSFINELTNQINIKNLQITKEFFSFFGKQVINNNKIFITSIIFNDSKFNPSNGVISLYGYSPNGQTAVVTLYPLDDTIQNLDYWNKLLHFFNRKELLKELKYTYTKWGINSGLELKIQKIINKFNL